MAQESRGQARREQFRARMVEQMGAKEAQALDEAFRAQAVSERRSLRLNTLKIEDAHFFEICGFRILEKAPFDVGGFLVELPEGYESAPALGAGLGYLQDLGSMEVVQKLNPQPGDLVLDLCAAPGGKSTQILEKIGRDQGWLVANDPVRSRAERLNVLVARHGSPRVTITSQDPDKLSQRFESFFDKVLVDAPSSGESFLAKRNDTRVDITDAEVAGCARRQFLILDRAAKMTKPGGTLVYSTATYSKQENSDLIKSFLDLHEEFELVEQCYRFPHIDNIPGGYWAVLKKKGIFDPSQHWAQLPDVSGLLRQSVCLWDGELDFYSRAMIQNFSEDMTDVFKRLKYPVDLKNEDLHNVFQAGFLELSDLDARKFLCGESLAITHAKGLCVLTWQGFPLGHGKSTGDRINNLLPKIIRAQR